MAKPDKITIRYEDDDDGRFNCVGRCTAGPPRAAQFMAFVTGAYPRDRRTGLAFPRPDDPDWAQKKRWYGVVHIFDIHGEHLDTRAHLGGTTADGQAEACERAFALADEALDDLGQLHFQDIQVRLFALEIDGYFFGLEYASTSLDGESVTLQPNDIMFHPPWDGDYST